VPTIVFHGDRDTTVSPIKGDQVIAQSKNKVGNLQSTVSQDSSAGGMRCTQTVQADEGWRPLLEQWVFTEPATLGPVGAMTGHIPTPLGPMPVAR
jgi:hypothetical protein